MRFNLVNLEAMKDLPPGKYATRVLDYDHAEATPEWVVNLEYVGPYNPDSPCLFPITKAAPEEEDG